MLKQPRKTFMTRSQFKAWLKRRPKGWRAYPQRQDRCALAKAHRTEFCYDSMVELRGASDMPPRWMVKFQKRCDKLMSGPSFGDESITAKQCLKALARC